MRQEISYCTRCLQELEKYGKHAADAYKEICTHYCLGHAVKGQQGALGRGEAMVRFLELKGYVVTVDLGQKELFIKPIGYMKKFHGYKYDHVFCIGHQNEIEKKDEKK